MTDHRVAHEQELPRCLEDSFGQPRAGHGFVVVRSMATPQSGRDITWVAVWVDEHEFMDVDRRRVLARTTTFDGGKVETLAWARAQPAAAHVFHNDNGDLTTLPEADDEVVT